ncbi:hypothetical protein C1O57_10390 [Akkermansia muciniphila]|nr:hypothetical protein C1O57_10390 [Akkermansia muciniphila]
MTDRAASSAISLLCSFSLTLESSSLKNLSRSSRISFCLAASSRARRSLICLFHRSGKESNPGGSVPKGTFGCQPAPWDWEESLQPAPAVSKRDSITEERMERKMVDSLSIGNGKTGVFYL